MRALVLVIILMYTSVLSAVEPIEPPRINVTLQPAEKPTELILKQVKDTNLKLDQVIRRLERLKTSNRGDNIK